MLSERERPCSLPQNEEVGSVSVSYSCSLVCLTLPILQEKNGNQAFVLMLSRTLHLPP